MTEATFKPFRREIFLRGHYEFCEVIDWRVMSVESPLNFPTRQGIRGKARRDNGDVVYVYDALGTICEAEPYGGRGPGKVIDEEAFFAGEAKY